MEKQSDLLLDIQHLHTAYRLQGKFYDAADDVNLTLKRDEILAIVGESGCGKSTIASSIIGLYDHKNTKVTGDILYNELNLVGLNESLFNKIRGDKIRKNLCLRKILPKNLRLFRAGFGREKFYSEDRVVLWVEQGSSTA